MINNKMIEQKINNYMHEICDNIKRALFDMPEVNGSYIEASTYSDSTIVVRVPLRNDNWTKADIDAVERKIIETVYADSGRVVKKEFYGNMYEDMDDDREPDIIGYGITFCVNINIYSYVDKIKKELKLDKELTKEDYALLRLENRLKNIDSVCEYNPGPVLNVFHESVGSSVVQYTFVLRQTSNYTPKERIDDINMEGILKFILGDALLSVHETVLGTSIYDKQTQYTVFIDWSLYDDSISAEEKAALYVAHRLNNTDVGLSAFVVNDTTNYIDITLNNSRFSTWPYGGNQHRDITEILNGIIPDGVGYNTRNVYVSIRNDAHLVIKVFRKELE